MSVTTFAEPPEPSQDAREHYVDLILHSKAGLRVVVAGPGTGKTYLFAKEVDKYNSDKKPLVISFLRALVEEMEPVLGERALVRTFHAYCKREFISIYKDEYPGFKHHYPALGRILEEDLKLLSMSATEREIEARLHQRISDEVTTQVFSLGERYAAYGHTDLVARVVNKLEDGGTVPEHVVVIVDEYQDFSPLERRFIEFLADRNTMLVAGDDDQALYEFKHAGPDGMRKLFAEAPGQFSLPYCSRCTSVVVAAANRTIKKALASGLLKGRVDKPFVCYTPDKGAASDAYPNIIHAKCTTQTTIAPYMCKYVDAEIGKIPQEHIASSWKNKYPTALVIGPDPFRKQVYKYLAERRPNVAIKAPPPIEVSYLDALHILVNDKKANLGWRIVAYLRKRMSKPIKEFLESDRQMVDFIPQKTIDEVLKAVSLCRQLLADGHLSDDETKLLEAFAQVTVDEIKVAFGLEPKTEDDGDVASGSCADDQSKPRILCTSFEGSKGLSAEHVFIVGLSDGHVPRNPKGIKDVEVMKLVVALTRTRQCCHLISCNWFGPGPLRDSSFLNWMSDLLETRAVNKSYISGLV